MMTKQAPAESTAAKRGAADAGLYFTHMAEFIGFTAEDAEAIKQSKPIIVKHLPEIVAKFYAHLLRYPPTRAFFLKKDGSVDSEYLELRMRHLTNFWVRTAEGVFDDDYARYVDYVGRAHTSRGADPSIYVAERYVIGQVGMVQHAISAALSRELRDGDKELEFRAVEAWDKLMMVILELLARAYSEEREQVTFDPAVSVDRQMVIELAKAAFAREQGEAAPLATRSVDVAEAADIPEGERKIVKVDGLTIGVFHHNGGWYALRSSCVHRGGPVATGALEGDILTCPWHGFQYTVTDGRCLADPSAQLDIYPVAIEDGRVYLHVPDAAPPARAAQPAGPPAANAAHFRAADIASGHMRKVRANGEDVAVYNVGGVFYATQDACPHAGGSLSESDLEGTCVTCFLHGSQFDVATGKVICDPATEPLVTYQVTVQNGLGVVTARR
jgi:nitrite reductase/ring-hydroxylating ferredoxin subunit/hemoglobin-like flavoprotein